jgi:hypothetical protein
LFLANILCRLRSRAKKWSTQQRLYQRLQELYVLRRWYCSASGTMRFGT